MSVNIGIDFLNRGVAHGDVADRLLAANMDHNVLRPWINNRGQSCVSVFNGFKEDGKTPKFRTVIANSPATLMKNQWQLLDEAVVRAARPMLRVWGDIVGQGLTYNVPNGMSVTVLQHQSMTDAGEAGMSMDALRKTNRDRPQFDIVNLPLPIVHGEFSFSLREIMVSRSQKLPLDTTMLEQVTRKCVEQVERLTLGTAGTYTYGGGTIYGLTNYSPRLTKVLTLPTSPSWEPETLINEVLDMIQSLQDIYFNGPYMVWISPGWTKYLDADYAATYGGKTLRQRLNDIDDLKFVRKADYLNNFQIVVAQATSDVIQAITGMRLQTLQWDSSGGLEKHYKLMGIMVPRLKSNSNGNTGICHGTAA